MESEIINTLPFKFKFEEIKDSTQPKYNEKQTKYHITMIISNQYLDIRAMINLIKITIHRSSYNLNVYL